MRRDHHYREDGRPKVRYARRRDAERAAKMMTGGGARFRVYRCCRRDCGSWHVGKAGVLPMRDPALYAELDLRVVRCLVDENTRQDGDRRQRIGQRVRSALKHAQRRAAA